MNQLPSLLKREFLEHRNMLFYVPLVITAILIVLQVIALIAVGTGGEWMTLTIDTDDGEQRQILVGPWFQEMLANLATLPPGEQASAMEAAYVGVSWPLFATLWVFVFFYLLGTLYDDRRDRSVLFWKSMPVSDTLTIVSKLVTALLVIPAIYFACVLVVHLTFLVTSTLSLDAASATAKDVVFDPVGVFGRWLTIVGFHLVTIAWCAPFYAWVLLVSAWARSVPFVWAIAVPFTLGIVDKLMITGELGEFMGRHTWPVGWDDEHVMTLGETFVSYSTDWELLVATAIAAVFIYLTIRIRGRADEI